MNLFWWRKHKWEFSGGYWVIPKKAAIIKRTCSRCGLYQEISQDHVNGVSFLEKEVKR